MMKGPGTKFSIIVLLLMMFSSGAAYADTISNLSLRINTGAIGVVVGDNSALDTDFRSGYISFGGFVGMFFVGSATASREIIGNETILTLGSQIGHFGTASGGQIVVSAEETGAYSTPVATFKGDVTASMYGGSATFQTWINSYALFAGSGALIVNGSASQNVEANVSNPYSHSSQATLVFPTTGGTANFSFKSVLAPPSGTAVPEPLSLLLLGSGLVGLGTLTKKRRQTV